MDESQIRYMVFYENRIVSVQAMQEAQTRSYGSHFSAKDKDKLGLPKITYNGVVKSVKDLRDLIAIRLINYNQIQKLQQEQPDHTNLLIKIQLEWRPSALANPY